MSKYDRIYRWGQWWNYYDSYHTFRDAYNVARKYKRLYKTKYFIEIIDGGYWIPQKLYKLYFNKLLNISLF